jgi:DNA repair protein RadD
MQQLSLVAAPEKIELRPYQLEAIQDTEDLIVMGSKAVLVVAPTGAGKTVIAAEMIRRYAEKQLRQAFLAPRRELIHQTCRKLDDVAVPYGVLLAGDKRTDQYAAVQVASVDTMISRALRQGKHKTWPDFDVIYIDEAHVGLTETRERLLRLWPNAKIIGFTATPCRSDGKALGRIYDEMVQVVSVAELTRQGFLVPGRYFSVSEPDLKGIRRIGGDFNQGQLADRMNKPKLVGDIVEHWLEHAPTRRTVVFATSIEHSMALCKEFIEHGVSAEHVDANTPQTARESTFDNFSTGRTQVLTNCTLASIGFDLPELDCVVFARPTASTGLYLQMLGRGLRPAPGKADCLVLDHAGNVVRHGFATDDRYWTLNGKYAQDEEKLKADRERKEKAEELTIKCPQCKALFSMTNQCPECGYFFPPKAKRLTVADGKLVELGPKDAGPTPQDRADFYRELLGYCKIKGFKTGFAAHKFREKFGVFPPFSMNDLEPVTPTIPVLRWIKSRQIAYFNARRATEQTLSATQPPDRVVG